LKQVYTRMMHGQKTSNIRTGAECRQNNTTDVTGKFQISNSYSK